MRGLLAAVAAALVATLAWPAAAPGHHVELPSAAEELLDSVASPGPAPGDPMYTADDESDGMSLIGNLPYLEGSDLAFQGNTVVAGNYGNPGGFRLIDVANPQKPKLDGQFKCAGPQGDVSVWGDLVFVSVDSVRTNNGCGENGSKSTAKAQSSWEGIRVVDISDRADPVQVAAVATDCGSHTHTLVPDAANGRVLLYVQSYPLGAPTATCNTESHGKISVVEVPLADPASARVASTPTVRSGAERTPIGCHDTTVLMPRMLAASACITESQLWALAPIAGIEASKGASLTQPKIIARISNPLINIHHSSAFSNDGGTLVIGDEFAGAAANSPCGETGGDHLPLGAMWFYDLTDLTDPKALSHYRIPETPTPRCGAHNFNPVPLKDGRDVLASAWYEGGSGLIDFTDRANPKRLAHYIPRAPQAESWSTYWYNGHMYSSNFAYGRGLDVFQADKSLLGPMDMLGRLNPQTQDFLIGG